MWSVCIKELRQFFSGLTGYVAIILFLLLNGLMLFVFRDSSILENGYASLEQFFSLAPWILLLLIPAVTMRLFADEWKTGTIEILRTRPLTNSQIVWGKYVAALIVVLLALLPTLTYVYTIHALAAGGASLDTGGIIGSYIGLFFLCATFTAIGTWCSSFTQNSVVAFLISAFGCFVLYNGFHSVSQLPQLAKGPDYYVEMLGIDFHYQSISKGVIDTRDLIYFASLVVLFLLFTQQRLLKKI